METVEGAYELAPERFEAVECVALIAAKVEVEGPPVRVGVAAVVAEDIEIRFPLDPPISRPNRVRQRPVEGIAPRNAEQLNRSVVDAVRQLLELVVEQSVAGLEVEQALDGGDGRQATEDDLGHAS